MSNQSIEETQKIVASLCERYLSNLVNSYKQNGDINGSSDSNDPSSTIYSAEIQLWNQLKRHIETHENNLVNCIHGFYVYILQVLYSLIKSHSSDSYYGRFPTSVGVDLKESDKLLLYNIYMRLGDLNRSLKNLKVARYYYLQACELDPYRGHAYNQLSLVTTAQVFNSLYYSVRALMASEDAVPTAKNNIDSLVNRCSLTNPNIEPLFLHEEFKIDPDRVENWLHFVIVTIYCDKLKVVLPHIIKEVDKQLVVDTQRSIETITMPKSDSKWIFASLDVAIDMVMSQVSDDKLNSFELEKEMLEVKGKFLTLIKDKKLVPTTNDGLALKHDYLLCGFAPLKEVHNQLNFSIEPPKDHENIQQLILRILLKMEKLISLLAERKAKNRTKKSRNIALQSILGSKGSS